MHFKVLVDDKAVPVELGFGGSRDLSALSHWRPPRNLQDNVAVRDCIEFARLASKRHRHYAHSIPTPEGTAEFREIIRASPHAEVALLFAVRSDWFKHSPIVGIAQCRRTYCHHLILEFLVVHPTIVGHQEPQVLGVGKGLLFGLVELARSLGISLIWGEATAHSAPFYSHVLATPDIQDHFFIRDDVLVHCCREFREKFFGELD
jgi:hypothetical protein